LVVPSIEEEEEEEGCYTGPQHKLWLCKAKWQYLAGPVMGGQIPDATHFEGRGEWQGRREGKWNSTNSYAERAK
jgi:hypothetical protein